MLFFLGLILSLSVGAQTVEDLCGNKNPNSMVTSGLEKDSKYEWCFGGVCEENSTTYERKKCVKQIQHGEGYENTFMVGFDEVHSKPGSVSYKGYGAFYRLYPGDACFEECRPAAKQFLGMTTGKKLGIEKQECVKCMIKLPTQDPESYEVVGHGVTVYKGQKCYYQCRLPSGPYLDHRPYSNDCLTCIGSMGLKPFFEYLQNFKGECFEIRDDHPYKGVSKVSENFCKNKEKVVHGTYFMKSSKYSVDYLIFGRPQQCFEVDDMSGGDYYKNLVGMDKCDPTYNDSQRGVTEKSSLAPSRQQSKSKGAIAN